MKNMIKLAKGGQGGRSGGGKFYFWQVATLLGFLALLTCPPAPL